MRRTSSSASPTTSSRPCTRRVGTRTWSPGRAAVPPLVTSSSSGSGSAAVVVGSLGTVTGEAPRAPSRARRRTSARARAARAVGARDRAGERLGRHEQQVDEVLRTSIRPCSIGTSRSSDGARARRPRSSPSMRAEPLTVCASRMIASTGCRGERSPSSASAGRAWTRAARRPRRRRWRAARGCCRSPSLPYATRNREMDSRSSAESTLSWAAAAADCFEPTAY